MKQSSFKSTVGLAGLVILLPALAFAYGGQRRPGEANGPPEAAIEACTGKNVGEVVEFAGRHGDTIAGACQGKDGQMFAVPEEHRRGRGAADKRRNASEKRCFPVGKRTKKS